MYKADEEQHQEINFTLPCIKWYQRFIEKLNGDQNPTTKEITEIQQKSRAKKEIGFPLDFRGWH